VFTRAAGSPHPCFVSSLSHSIVMSRVVCGAHPHLLAPWTTRLLSQWMLQWWRVNVSTQRQLSPCTDPSISSVHKCCPTWHRNRFGAIKSCEIIRDYKTGDSLQYAFIEFETADQCEQAYKKMDNVLIDDRRIHVDFSQSVSKLQFPKHHATKVSF